MLSLTREEVELLLQVSTMNIYTDYRGGPDTALELCPLCRGHICENDEVSKYVSKDYFDLNILPINQEFFDEWSGDTNAYHQVRVYMIDSKLIPFPHEKGCKIEDLKTLHKKMKNSINGES